MAFERNDIVNKTRLAGELGEELMGFEHNDIVTVDVMNEAIAEGGGGGGDGTKWTVVFNSPAFESGYLSANYVYGSDDVGSPIMAQPYYDGNVYDSVSFDLSAGLENLEVGFIIYDNYDGSSPVKFEFPKEVGYTAAVTGDITFSTNEWSFIFTLTGSGTVTITES